MQNRTCIARNGNRQLGRRTGSHCVYEFSSDKSFFVKKNATKCERKDNKKRREAAEDGEMMLANATGGKFRRGKRKYGEKDGPVILERERRVKCARLSKRRLGAV